MTRLRRHAGLLIISIGLAMGIFVLWDMLWTTTWGGGGASLAVGEIAGHEVEQPEYQRILDQIRFRYEQLLNQQISEELDPQIHQEAWQTLLQKYIIEASLERLHLIPTDEEILNEWVTSTHPHPIIRQLFTDPSTGEFRPEFVAAFLEQIEFPQSPEQQRMRDLWTILFPLIRKDVIFQRYMLILQRTWYVPTWLKEELVREQQVRIQAKIQFLPYAQVPDTFSLSDEEIQEYADANPGEFALDFPVRFVRYVAWELRPQQKDSQELWQIVHDCIEQWKQLQDDSLILLQCSDQPPQVRIWTREELPASLVDTLWTLAQTMDSTEMFAGPWWLTETPGNPYGGLAVYRLERGLQEVPESLHLRHIYRNAITPRQRARAYQLLDSLRQILETTPEQWDSLVQRFSEAPTKQNQGKVGWLSYALAPPSLQRRLFESHPRPGMLVVVSLPDGVHLFRVDSVRGTRQGIRAAFLIRYLTPGKETMDEYRTRATSFLLQYCQGSVDSFEAGAQREGLLIRLARLTPDQFTVPGLEQARELVRWAFQADEGEFSDLIQTDRYLIIGYLFRVYEAGDIPYEDVYFTLRAHVLREKQKTWILSRAGTPSDFRSFASAHGGSFREVSFTFADRFLPGIGGDAILIGALAGGPASGTLVAGDEGVSLVEHVQVPDTTAVMQMEFLKDQASARLTSMYFSRLMQELWNWMMVDFEVHDYRFRFY